jgi:hypothetical protein
MDDSDSVTRPLEPLPVASPSSGDGGRREPLETSASYWKAHVPARLSLMLLRRLVSLQPGMGYGSASTIPPDSVDVPRPQRRTESALRSPHRSGVGHRKVVR